MAVLVGLLSPRFCGSFRSFLREIPYFETPHAVCGGIEHGTRVSCAFGWLNEIEGMIDVTINGARKQIRSRKHLVEWSDSLATEVAEQIGADCVTVVDAA